MKKFTLQASAAMQALALLGAGAGAAFVAAPAAAQDYTSGVISGTVTDESGNPLSGATVTLTSRAQGFTRTATSSGNGGFRFNGLPGGEYNVAVEAAGNGGFQATDVRVLAGQTASLDIQLSSAQDIVVTGAQIQSFEGTTTGLNVDVEEIVKTVPISRTLTDVTLLAPGTTKGDSAFGNLASIGGSSVAENAYYLNGLNTTNFDNYLGSARVPFEFYKSVEVKSGGYPAEFGRATGGIVNAVSKSGSNDITAAFHLNWEPEFLKSDGTDLINCSSNGTCDPYTRRELDESSSLSAIAELGLPIIRDRLFAYGLVELRRSRSSTISRTGGTRTEDRANDPFYAIKIDAYPVDNHHLEFTLFDTTNTTVRRTFDYDETPDGDPIFGALGQTRNFYSGGVNFVGKYTGRFTDWLTLSGAYGRMRDRFDDIGLDASAANPFIQNASGATFAGVANGGLYNGQTASSRQFPYNTERKFYRADADVYVNLFGDHHFRGGFDQEKNTLEHSSVRTGGGVLCGTGFLTAAACGANGGGGGAALIFRAPFTTGVNAGRPVLEVNYFNSGGAFTSTNTAYYLQDEWKTPLDGLTLNLGVRRDDFNVDDPSGDTFVSLKKNYSPRLGFTYDVFPAAKGQVFGSYGTYYLPIASNTAFRAVGAEYYIRERYFVNATTPFLPNGLPNIVAPVTNAVNYDDACAINLTALSTGVNCNQTGDGLPKDATYYLSRNLKPTKEAEWILGYRQRVRGVDLEAAFTHRKVKRLNEDASLDEAIVNYCQANGVAGCEDFYTTGSHQFAIVNIGEDTEITVDGGPLDGQVITIPAELTGYPKARRTYTALDLSFNRPFDGKWSLAGSYTWSKSKGNSEGFVNSDIGQDDAGVTADFDFAGFTEYAYGNLPNDRRHRFKLFGAYAITDNITVGANYRLESPRSLSCFGWNPNNYFANNYAAAYNHYCGGEPAPRGTGNKTDWNSQLDLSGRYNFNLTSGSIVTLRADVFNVFNSQAINYRNEIGDLDAGAEDPITGLPTSFTPNPNYGQPRVYQSPRYARLGLDVAFGGAPAVVAPVVEAPLPPPPPAPAPATQTCADGSVILATDACPVPPPPPPPAPAPERG